MKTTAMRQMEQAMKRIAGITRTGRAATVLIVVFGAAVLTVVALGPVVAKGQQ